VKLLPVSSDPCFSSVVDPGFSETGYVSRAISLTGIQIQTRTQIFMTKREKIYKDIRKY
jgi:hypothetical protein